MSKSNPNFFIGEDALNCLLNMEFDEPEKDTDLTLDVIGLPVWFSFHSNAHTQTLKAYAQMELYMKNEELAMPKGSLVYDRASGKGTVDADNRTVGGLMQVFFVACRNLNALISEKCLRPLYDGLDPENAGILLSEKNGELSWDLVLGGNRPDLTVETISGKITTGRPYMEDFEKRSAMEDRDLTETIKAAEDGDQDCMLNLAQDYLNGDGVEQDFEKSAYWWKKLAEKDHPVAQFNLGLYYAKGCGLPQNFEKAAKWMKKAADNGDEDAPGIYELYAHATETVKKAETGDAAAQAEAAEWYMVLGRSLDQFGPDNDYKKAFAFAKKSADQGNTDGMYCLGLCYEHGRGTAKNLSRAAAVYEKAAKLGHAPSQWNLATCYLDGKGVRQDEVTGYVWAYQASDQGNELAVNWLQMQENTIEEIIDRGADTSGDITLAETQYEGRADRCASLSDGTELGYKVVKDEDGDNEIECFYNGGSVGLLSSRDVDALIALLRLDRIVLQIKVKKCVPKSKRGARAKNADVQLTLIIREETPEERKRKEEERKKAEEARIKAEEERQREIRQYEQSFKKWKKDCADIEAKRAAFVKAGIAEEKAAFVSEITKKRDEAVAKAKTLQKAQEKRKAAAESALASLGLFKFGEKRAQKSIIKEATQLLAEAEASIAAAKELYSAETDAADQRAESRRPVWLEKAEKELPLPAEPNKPASVKEKEKAEEAEKKAKEKSRPASAEDAIVEYLGLHGPATVKDMIENIPLLENETVFSVGAVMRQLMFHGMVIMEKTKRETYFRLV